MRHEAGRAARNTVGPPLRPALAGLSDNGRYIPNCSESSHFMDNSDQKSVANPRMTYS